jgi:hypothetical protein
MRANLHFSANRALYGVGVAVCDLGDLRGEGLAGLDLCRSFRSGRSKSNGSEENGNQSLGVHKDTSAVRFH